MLWSPADYEKGSFFQRKIAENLLRGYKFPSNACILDVGCGSGSLSKYIAEGITGNYAVVDAIDVSNEMVNYAKANNNYHRINYECLDVLCLDKTNKYTNVVAFCSMHWVKQQLLALRRIKKALRPGGTILFALPSNHNDIIHHLIEDVASSERWLSSGKRTKLNIYSFSDNEYEKLLTSVGFSNVYVETKMMIEEFINTELLRAFVKGIPIFDSAEVNMDDFSSDVVSAFKKNSENRLKGKYLFRSSVLIAKANNLP